MECLSYCLAEKIDLGKLERKLRKETSFRLTRHDRVLELVDEAKHQNCYIFTNGTLVSWNVKRHQLPSYFAWVESGEVTLLKKKVYDNFSYRIDTKTAIYPHKYFNIECLVLENDEDETKLSLSYGLSQSIKLKYYESLSDKITERYMPLMNEIAERGHLNLSQRRIRQIIGDILSVKCEINVAGNFLYTPKFFWRHPSLENYFNVIEKYLDIPERVATLNYQLNTLNEIFILCSNYIDSRHSHRLEIVIIVLITLELVFYLWNLHF